jgi:thymidylate kinase
MKSDLRAYCKVELQMPGRIIEIIGCSGSGKSTVAQQLSEDDCVLTSIPPAEYKKQCLKYTILRLPKLLVLSLLKVRHHHLKTLIRAEATLAVVQHGKKKHPNPDKTLILDRGPISRLVHIYRRGVSNKIVERWLKALQKTSFQTLDLVVWLDAPNDVLQFRVNNRHKNHRMKNKPKELLDGFYTTYRACLKNLINNGTNEIHCEYINTEDMSIDDVSERIRKLL